MTALHRSAPAVGRALVGVHILSLVLALLGLTLAQGLSGPRVAVSPVSGPVGETVTVEADRLSPGARYRLEAVAPSGEREVREADASTTGVIRFELTLREPGTTELRLIGPEVEASLRVNAVAVDVPAATPRPTTPPTAPPTAPREAPREAPPAAPPAAPAAVTLVLDEDGATLQEADGSVRWRFTRPLGSGDTRAAVLHLGRAWIAHGHTLLELDLDDGHVLTRTPVSGPIVSLAPVGTGVRVTAEVRAGDETLRVEHRVEDGVATPLPSFDTGSPLLQWWQAEALVADPTAAAQRDPTNPYLHLRVAALAEDEVQRDAALAAAVAAGGPFFERTHVARALAAFGDFAAADDVMRAALADFEERGYDAGLLTDADIHERYGFPLRPLVRALNEGDREAAELWAGWLPRTAAPGMPGAAAALREYADMQRRDGDEEGAATTRERAAKLAATSVRDVLNEAAVNLGRGGWYAASALVVAALMLHLTLVAKYWRVQTLLMRRARESGRRAGAAWRWRAIRHYGTTEKLALVLLLAAAHVMAALTVWSEHGDAAVAAAAGGHLGAPFVEPLLRPGEMADEGQRRLLDAYRLAQAGEAAAAERLLEQAVLTGVAEADVALAAVQAGEPVPAPSPTTLRAAVAGTWTRAVANAFRDPFGTLAAATVPASLPAWSAPLLLGAFLVVGVFHLVLLLVPRPRLARNAPRTYAYHLLALLVPGSGATDELWGVLLLVPWAVFGIDALAQVGWSVSPLGIPLVTGTWVLAAIYAVNLVAWGIELSSYLRRMRDLRRDQPDLAREFAMRPLPADA